MDLFQQSTHRLSRLEDPTDKACFQAFDGTPRAECFDVHWLDPWGEAKHLLEAWRREYNESRPHASLGDRTPSEFASQYPASHVLAET